MTAEKISAIAALTGYATAVPTPFKNNAIDVDAFQAFCDWQIEQGISALAVTATTGESPTLSDSEQRCLIRAAVDTARGRVPVIAGAGSCDTRHAVALARQAEEEGSDALLAVTPYYNRPSQDGLWQHFEAIHNATAIPVILYDVPSRTGCSLEIDTIVRLAKLPRIVGLKDATGDFTRTHRLRKLLGPQFRLLSGDDATALDFLAMGGDGCISVLSNVVPSLCVQLYAAWKRGDNVEARTIARNLSPLTTALFADSNPVPVKCALDLMGRMSADVRLPLCHPSFQTRVQIVSALSRLGLIGAPQTPILRSKPHHAAGDVAATIDRC